MDCLPVEATEHQLLDQLERAEIQNDFLCRQVVLLNRRILALDVRIHRAIQNRQPRSIASLQRRKSVLEDVHLLFCQIIQTKWQQIEDLRTVLLSEDEFSDCDEEEEMMVDDD